MKAVRAFDKNELFQDKNTWKTRNRRKLFHMIEGIYEKPTANNILSSEKLKAFPLKMRNNKRMFPMLLLLNFVLEVLEREIMQ